MVNNAAIVEQPRSALPQRDAFLSHAAGAPDASEATVEDTRCFHCGLPCDDTRLFKASKAFCCQGCLTVFELLTENGLSSFYQFGEATGIRGRGTAAREQFSFVDAPLVRTRLVDYSDAKLTRLRLRLPAIHCLACVWLLENLFRLNAGIGHSEVNFPRQEVAIAFDTSQVKLSEVLGLLTSLGYEPELKLSDLSNRPNKPTAQRLWLQLGIAGFAFGNTMLFSIASYLGLDSATGPGFRKLVGALSLVLTLPVVIYSAQEYWRSAWVGLRQRLLNIDVPIALGILALYLESAYEVLSGRGGGYFDSLAGLVFFLLCGRLFQRKTFDRLAFDRDYRSFFPLAVARKKGRGEERVSLSELQLEDRLLIRNGELIPADSRLVEGQALIDYSFVTGESEPVAAQPGDYLYAGGRQIGAAIEVETVKAVSQGYLTSLWDQESFRKTSAAESLQSLTNRYSQRFTKLVIAVALGAAAFWSIVQPSLALKAFTSVLIVACPCALALAAPFALGTALRVLARRNVFLKNTTVLERLAAANTIVFDKTGTLTTSNGPAKFRGSPLAKAERSWLYSLAWQSNHPLASRLTQALSPTDAPWPVASFREVPGSGMKGEVSGHVLWAGSAAWLAALGLKDSASTGEGGAAQEEGGAAGCSGSVVHIAIDEKIRGSFDLTAAVRPGIAQLVDQLRAHYDLSLLSGDNERERSRFAQLFGPSAKLHFAQSPLDKLNYVCRLQEEGRTVIMVGDGLNDAGALQQSDIGMAVVENVSAFSPASDAIVTADNVLRLSEVLRFAQGAVRVVRGSFLISSLYNVIGISIAARGLLSPIVCAILMPLSSVTVVAFACAMTHWLGRRLFAAGRAVAPSSLDAGRWAV